jgi:3-isopropylmalate/(R)-2-methylmalate dehydratase large subunit
MTITEKILAKNSGKSTVKPGETLWVNVDLLMTHDVCGPGTIGIFKKHFGNRAKVWNPNKIVVIPDHYIFTEDKHAKRNIDILRSFAEEQNLPYFYDVGTERYKGVCHISLMEEGFTIPGKVLFGTDSHTCTAGAFGLFSTGIGNTDAAYIMGTGKLWLKVPHTMKIILEDELPPYVMAKDFILQIIGDLGEDGATYRSLEFDGEGIYRLTMEERMTLCNMVVEAGAKNGIVAADQTTMDYLRSRSHQEFEIAKSDPGEPYLSIHIYQGHKLEPVVAKPFSPANIQKTRELKHIQLDQCYIGSCTGGKLHDFRAAATILNGNRVKVKTLLVPATREIEKKLLTETFEDRILHDIFLEAGVKIGPPSCAACLGGPDDTFGRLKGNEVCLSTTNRNFPGRMGSENSKTYLASPLTVAASALTGRITDPREFLS